jgi:hypothetical protein
MGRLISGDYAAVMDSVAFRIELDELAGGGPFPVVAIYVDGHRLQDLARVVELPFAEAEGKAALAGSYAGLSPSMVVRGSRHFMGEPDEVWFDDGDTILLGCVCGELGCWPLTARVEVGETTVTWTDFRTGHRNWDLSGLGPFVFDRRQYERALADAT